MNKTFKWNVEYNGKKSVVEANTQVGARKEAKKVFGIKTRDFDLTKIKASIKR